MIQACLPAVERLLAEQKRESGAYDFDEIIAGVVRAIDGPAGAGLIRLLRERYRYALVDEFQDTDELQWDVFRRVFVESNGPHRAYLIADPKQSIYGFRGADVRAHTAAQEARRARRAGKPDRTAGQLPLDRRIDPSV